MEKRTSKVVYIIGNQFAEFAKMKPNTMLLSDFEKAINKNEIVDNQCKYVFGQGISIHFQKKLLNRARLQNLTHVFPNHVTESIEPCFTHKKNEKNIMITTPRKLSDDHYSTNLILDAPVELEDHVTGQHIPAMVLIEAARQFFIAIMEKYYLNQNPPKKEYYFVLNQINSRFLNYVFPIPAKINAKVESFKQINPNNFSAKCELCFFQYPDRLCSSINMEFGMIYRKILSLLENNNAKEVLSATLSDQTNCYEKKEL